MRIKLAVSVAGLDILLGAGPALAHHAFAAEYDASKPIKLTGTVTKVEWMNPHAWFYLDVKDGSWRADITPSNVVAWFASYTAFVDHYLDIAKAHSVEEFTLGVELINMTQPKYDSNWSAIIADARARFPGPSLPSLALLGLRRGAYAGHLAPNMPREPHAKVTRERPGKLAARRGAARSKLR